MTRPELLEALLADPARAGDLTAPEAADLAADLAPVLAALTRRASQPEAPEAMSGADGAAPKDGTEGDRLLTADQAAARLGVSPRWLRGRRLPFRRELSPRRVRYSEAGLERYLQLRPRA